MDESVPSHILISGASSGIGAALALHYAGPNRRLALGGRSEARLTEVAASCRQKGAEVDLQVSDLRDSLSTRKWIESADDRQPIDLLIANAGISGGTYGGTESEEQTRAIFDVNVTGVLNTVLPALPRMEGRQRGQIALISSLAGYRGFPGAPAYCASKAAIKVWGEALRGQLAPKGVKLSVVLPGYIKTPMTDINDFPMPFLMPVDRAAAIIARGLARNRPRIAFPWPTATVAWLIGALSPAITDSLLSKMPKKN